MLLDIMRWLLHALLESGDRCLLLIHDLMADRDIVRIGCSFRVHVSLATAERQRWFAYNRWSRKIFHKLTYVEFFHAARLDRHAIRRQRLQHFALASSIPPRNIARSVISNGSRKSAGASGLGSYVS